MNSNQRCIRTKKRIVEAKRQCAGLLWSTKCSAPKYQTLSRSTVADRNQNRALKLWNRPPFPVITRFMMSWQPISLKKGLWLQRLSWKGFTIATKSLKLIIPSTKRKQLMITRPLLYQVRTLASCWLISVAVSLTLRQKYEAKRTQSNVWSVKIKGSWRTIAI